MRWKESIADERATLSLIICAEWSFFVLPQHNYCSNNVRCCTLRRTLNALCFIYSVKDSFGLSRCLIKFITRGKSSLLYILLFIDSPEIVCLYWLNKCLIKGLMCLQVIAIAMDVFTDVDIFKELISATLRGVMVYILLDDSHVKSFLKMSHNVGVNINDLKVRNTAPWNHIKTMKGSDEHLSEPCWTAQKHKNHQKNSIIFPLEQHLWAKLGDFFAVLWLSGFHSSPVLMFYTFSEVKRPLLLNTRLHSQSHYAKCNFLVPMHSRHICMLRNAYLAKYLKILNSTERLNDSRRS